MVRIEAYTPRRLQFSMLLSVVMIALPILLASVNATPVTLVERSKAGEYYLRVQGDKTNEAKIWFMYKYLGNDPQGVYFHIKAYLWSDEGKTTAYLLWNWVSVDIPEKQTYLDDNTLNPLNLAFGEEYDIWLEREGEDREYIGRLKIPHQP